MFINKILHPIYNDSIIDISPYFIINKENYYKGYSNINKNFADTIMFISDKDPKMILINDIDLAFVPIFYWLISENINFLKENRQIILIIIKISERVIYALLLEVIFLIIMF